MSSVSGPILAVIALFLFIFVAVVLRAACEQDGRREGQRPRGVDDRSRRIVISRQVPSVSDTFREARDRWRGGK